MKVIIFVLLLCVAAEAGVQVLPLEEQVSAEIARLRAIGSPAALTFAGRLEAALRGEPPATCPAGANVELPESLVKADMDVLYEVSQRIVEAVLSSKRRGSRELAERLMLTVCEDCPSPWARIAAAHRLPGSWMSDDRRPRISAACASRATDAAVFAALEAAADSGRADSPMTAGIVVLTAGALDTCIAFAIHVTPGDADAIEVAAQQRYERIAALLDRIQAAHERNPHLKVLPERISTIKDYLRRSASRDAVEQEIARREIAAAFAAYLDAFNRVDREAIRQAVHPRYAAKVDAAAVPLAWHTGRHDAVLQSLPPDYVFRVGEVSGDPRRSRFDVETRVKLRDGSNVPRHLSTTATWLEGRWVFGEP